MRRVEYLAQKQDFLTLTAAHLMEQNVIACRPEDTCRYAASQLTKINCGSLPVVDEDRCLLGIVSEFDILNCLLEGKDLREVKVGKVMTREVKFVREETPVMEIIRLLEEDHLIRVPVMRDGKLAGIVARRDILLGYIKSTASYWP